MSCRNTIILKNGLIYQNMKKKKGLKNFFIRNFPLEFLRDLRGNWFCSKKNVTTADKCKFKFVYTACVIILCIQLIVNLF